MSPDYAGYSLDELYDAKKNINKELYPENFSRLLSEISQRQLAAVPAQQQITTLATEEHSGKKPDKKWSIPKTNQPSSAKRIFWILAVGISVSLLIIINAEPTTMPWGYVFASVVFAMICSVPLIHSFICGWTLSRHGIVTLKDDTLSFTVSQLFYSYLTCFTVMLTLARLP